jgi:hypothetical protein
MLLPDDIGGTETIAEYVWRLRILTDDEYLDESRKIVAMLRAARARPWYPRGDGKRLLRTASLLEAAANAIDEMDWLFQEATDEAFEQHHWGTGYAGRGVRYVDAIDTLREIAKAARDRSDSMPDPRHRIELEIAVLEFLRAWTQRYGAAWPAISGSSDVYIDFNCVLCAAGVYLSPERVCGLLSAARTILHHRRTA